MFKYIANSNSTIAIDLVNNFYHIAKDDFMPMSGQTLEYMGDTYSIGNGDDFPYVKMYGIYVDNVATTTSERMLYRYYTMALSTTVNSITISLPDVRIYDIYIKAKFETAQAQDIRLRFNDISTAHYSFGDNRQTHSISATYIRVGCVNTSTSGQYLNSDIHIYNKHLLCSITTTAITCYYEYFGTVLTGETSTYPGGYGIGKFDNLSMNSITSVTIYPGGTTTAYFDSGTEIIIYLMDGAA